MAQAVGPCLATARSGPGDAALALWVARDYVLAEHCGYTQE